MSRRPSIAFVICLVALLVCALGGGTAEGSIAIRSFSAVPSTTQAGAHPNVVIEYSTDTPSSPELKLPCFCNAQKDVTISLPAGFIGNPHAAPQCSAADFGLSTCPVDSQVGMAKPGVIFIGECPPNCLTFNSPIYNLVPLPGQAGLLGFKTALFNTNVFTQLSARTGSDYGLDATTTGILRALSLGELRYELWGVPASPSNNALRCPLGGLKPGLFFCAPGPESSNSPETPFLQNPTTCNVPLTSRVHVVSYELDASDREAPWPPTTGCDQLSFNPSLTAAPTTTETDTASGVDVDLTVPQEESPSTPSPSEIKATTVTLPEGFSINPNAADGKTSCTDVQARVGSDDEAQCPEYAKVGTDSVSSSALPGPILGGIYIGEVKPGERFRLILTADGFGTHVKLLGRAEPDPRTGQLVISFPNLPQSTFSDFNMHFFGSERGLMATPTKCGTYPVTSTFEPWDAALPNQTSSQFFTLNSGPNHGPCPGAPRPFKPEFSAATAGNTAGAHSPFGIELTRPDGDQNFAKIDVQTPPGLLASLVGVPYCPDAALAAAASPDRSGLAEQAAPSCPAASRIGTATSGAGAGTHPVYVNGNVYLAGPYKGAPLSLAVVTPVVSGPYDLGNVVVRVALNIKPTTLEIDAVSDPLPQIVEGILLRLRSIRFNLDRPGFMLNPTDCDPLAASAQITGAEGTTASLFERFQVANCAILPFEPKVSLRLSGGVNRRGHPAIHAVVRTQPGEANPKSISVTLPSSELLDNAHIGNVCTKVDFAKQACPAGSLLGRAEVTTPLLGQPLVGSAYLRSSGRGLPDMALDLYGQIHIEAVARIDAVRGGLRTTFATIPDAPLGTVTLDLRGGSKGLIQNSESLCGTTKKAKAKMVGQDNATSDLAVPLQVACGKAKKKHRQKAGA